MPQIFLDCDGVLADFELVATNIFGKTTHEAERELGDVEFWRRIRSSGEFYRNLPLMPDAVELFEALSHLKPILLTGCPKGGWAEPQKVEWAAEHFPGTPIITCESRNKRLHLTPGDILVDDFLKYRDLWIAAGGIFVHHSSAKDTLRQLAALGIPLKAEIAS